MTTIYELSAEQQEIQDELFWIDDETERAYLEDKINAIKGNAKNKIGFFATLLAESQRTEEAMEEAARKTRERLAVQRRKTESLKQFIGDMMDEFDLQKVVTDYVNVTRTKGRETPVFKEGHDVYELPDTFKRTKVIVEPDKKAIMAAHKNGELPAEVQEAVSIIRKPGLMLK